MRRPLPHRLALAAALVAVGLAVLAPLVAPCTAMAHRAMETRTPAPTDCGHGASPVEAPVVPRPADDSPARDGSCCLTAAPLPAPTAVPATVTVLAIAAPNARVADVFRPVEAVPTAPPTRPPPLALGVLYGVQRI